MQCVSRDIKKGHFDYLRSNLLLTLTPEPQANSQSDPEPYSLKLCPLS